MDATTLGNSWKEVVFSLSSGSKFSKLNKCKFNLVGGQISLKMKSL
jgi:hypothetical protein